MSRFRRMSTLESATVLAIFRLLISYSAVSWVSTVQTQSAEVANAIMPNTAKIPKRVR